MSGMRGRSWWRRVAALSGVCFLFAVLLTSPVLAQAGFSVDVGTDLGGEGQGAHGGTYQVGEATGIWVRVNAACDLTWSLSGPGGTSGESTRFPAAGTYSLDLGVAEASDVGTWTFSIRAISGSIVATDAVQFLVVKAGQSTPAATPALTPDVATALDALKALKMSQGTLTADLSFDVDRDGSVTADDARLILKWAVQ